MLSAAKYLRALNGSYGNFRSAVREYVDRAVAENPDSFEALLLWCQLRAARAGCGTGSRFRKLLEMNPNSVEALVGLGTRLAFDGRPEEAIGYLQKASLLDPERPPSTLGLTYEELGEYDKALVALKKSYKMTRSPVELAHIRAIEEGKPIYKPIRRESEEQSSQDLLPEETLSGSPHQEEEEPPAAPTKGRGGETTFDGSSVTEPLTDRDDTRKKRAQQAIEAEFEQLLADYERMIEGESDPSATVKGEIADLERESKPKLSPDDDPDDERGRRKSESNQKRRARSTERSEDDEDGDDARTDEDASEEDEER